MIVVLSLLGCMIAAVLILMRNEALRIQVNKITVELKQLPESFDGLKVFFISDIHTRTISDRLLKEVDASIDLVIIGGDLMEKNVPFERVERNIDFLSKLGPIYFVWGNNDYEVDYRQLDILLREKGVQILDNTCARLDNNQDTLYLLGVDDPTINRDQLHLALGDVSTPGGKILISHNPSIVKKIKEEDQIDLVLCGHTHGGQIRFFNWGIAERGGLKKHKATQVFISNGYGYTRFPLRLGAPAETHIITLQTKRS